MNYLLLLFSILLAVGCNILYHKLGDMRSPFMFSAVSSLSWVLMLIFGGAVNIQLTEVFFGVAYGIIQALFLYFKMRAMGAGPVSITTVIGNCSMLFSTIFGILYFKESVNLWQIFGVLGIIISVLLCLDAKSDMKAAPKWKFFCIGFFFFASATGIVFKLFSKTDGNGNNMMLISAFTMVLFMLTLSFLKKESVFSQKKTLLFSVLAGAMSLGYNRLNLYLSGALPSVIFFPIFNGAIVLIVTVLGILIFRERLSKKQISGVLLGLLAIILLGI